MTATNSSRPYDLEFRTVCGVCPAGCGLKLYVKDGQVVDLLGDEFHPVNQGALCARGSAFFQHFGNLARLQQAAFRQATDQEYTLHSWDEALDYAAARLKPILEQYGPQALAITASRTLEAGDRLGAAHLALATGARLLEESSPAAAGLGLDLLFPPEQWDAAGCVLVLGGDPAVDYPVAFRRVLEASARRTPVIAVAARFTSTLSKAELALQIRPGSEAVFLMALAKVLLEEQTPEEESGELLGEAAWVEAVKSLSWEDLEELTWLPQTSIRRAGLTWAAHLPGLLIGGGEASPEVLRAARWLLNLSNRRLKEKKADSASHCPRPSGWDWLSQSCWPTVSSLPGQASGEMDGSQPVRAVIGSGEFWPALEASLDLSQVELVVVFGAYPGQTYERAQVSLPAAGPGECECLFASHDRRLQRSPAAIAPPGEARSALEFWAGLGGRLSPDYNFPWHKTGGSGAKDFSPDWEEFLRTFLAEAGGIEQDALDLPGGPVWFTPDRSPAAPVPALGSPPHFDAPRPTPLQPLLLYRDTAQDGEFAWWSWLHPDGDQASFFLHPALAMALEVQNGEALVVDDGKRQLAGRATLTHALPERVIWASAGTPVTSAVSVFPRGGSPARALARLRVFFQNAEGE